LGRTALLGASAVLRREQLLPTGGRERGCLIGDQAQLAADTQRQLAPPVGGPQGWMGKLCMRAHMRILNRRTGPWRRFDRCLEC
jgi:hypothetical protein